MGKKHTFHHIFTDYYTSNVAVGDNGGHNFFYGVEEGKAPDSGRMVRSLKAWNNGSAMKALEVRLTDGSKHKFGHSSGTATDTFYFADGETISSLKMWYSNFHGGRMGRLEMTTDQNRKFTVNVPAHGHAYHPEIGSGLLIGVFGKCGSDIDCLGFAMLRRAKAQLINMEYPDITTLKVDVAPREIKTITYDNSNGEADQSFTLSGSESVEESEEWSVTAGVEASISTEVKARIPIFAMGKVTVSITMSVSGTYGRSNKKTTEQSFEFPILVPAGKRIKATATLYEGNINTKYTGTMLFTLDSGKTFQYDVSGMYAGISASQAIITTDEF